MEGEFDPQKEKEGETFYCWVARITRSLKTKREGEKIWEHMDGQHMYKVCF